MIKQVSLLKRHPSLTMEQFVEQYESGHAKFGEVLFKKATKLMRRYVQPQPNPLTGEVQDLDFDVILEVWFESQEDLDEAMRGIATSGLLDQVRESGARLFKTSNAPAFTVVEYESPVGN
jgi:EthD domain